MKLLGDKLQGGKEALEHLPLREGLRWWKQNSPQSGASGARRSWCDRCSYPSALFCSDFPSFSTQNSRRTERPWAGMLINVSPKPSSGLGMEQAFLEYCSSNPSHTWRRAWQPTPVFLPWESPWTEEPGELQSRVSQRAGHDWATKHNPSHMG